MLKPSPTRPAAASQAAAFRRLCVETSGTGMGAVCRLQPPSGGCVLKQSKPYAAHHRHQQPPSGGCVLKRGTFGMLEDGMASRLQAAVC